MESKTLKTLEYNKIIDLLVEEASCEGGRNLCRKLLPSSDINEINRLQIETSDALSRIFKKGSISFSGVHDIRASLKHLDIGGTLSTLELLRVLSLIHI